MAHTGDTFIDNDGKEYIYLSDDDNNYYLIKDGNYHLVATYGLASSISGMDPAGYDTELVTKDMVSETGCKFKDNTILPYNDLPDTVCVLYEDLEGDTDICLPSGEGEIEDGASGSYEEEFFRFYYQTNNNQPITPNNIKWYSDAGSDYDTYYYQADNVRGRWGDEAIIDQVADEAFSGITSLTQAILQCNLYRIGDEAFAGCSNLKEVHIYGDSSNSRYVGGDYYESYELKIDRGAFKDCTSLRTLILGTYWYYSLSKVVINSYAFSGCTSLNNILGQDNIIFLGQGAFYNCTNLNTLTLTGCTYYDDYAFGNCTGLKRIMMRGDAKAVTTPERVFDGCQNVKEIIFIGNNPTATIGKMLTPILNYNTNLVVRVPYDYLDQYRQKLVTYPGQTGQTWYQNLERNSYSSESEIILTSTREVPRADYSSTSGLIETAIIQGWLTYNTRTFTIYDAERVKNYELDREHRINGRYILSRGDADERTWGYQSDEYYVPLKDFSAFKYFTSVTDIPNESFKDGKTIKQIVLPNTVISIGEDAFNGCVALTSITIPDSVISIGENAFEDCDTLTSITIPSSVTYLGEGIIESCDAGVNVVFNAINCADLENSLSNGDSDVIKSITFSDNIIHIPACICKDSDSLSSITIPDSVITIGENAFEECENISSLTIGSNVTDIGENAFKNCNKITSLTIPNSVITIGENAFGDCTGLTTATIGSGVITIGGAACAYWYKLNSSLVVPDSVTEIGENAFADIANVIYHGTATGSPWGARSVNGNVDGNLVFEDSSKTTLVACFGNATSVNVPTSVVEIGGDAFEHCESLTTVNIPNNVTEIGVGAFYGCKGLTTVTLSNNITEIPSYTFAYCSSLSNITIPNSVGWIGNDAFTNCGLTSIIIPNNVASIDDSAFSGCYNLRNITIGNHVEYIGEFAFYGCESLAAVNIPNNVTEIGIEAFNGCKGLTTVTLSNNITDIHDKTFLHCESLTRIIIPNSVRYIGEMAFRECSSLSSVTIGSGVTRIATDAFYQCSRLNEVNYQGTSTQWYAISKGTWWNAYVPARVVHCLGDGVYVDI